MDEADCPRPLLGRDQPDRERLETRCNQNANLPSQRGYLADALRQGRATLSSPTAMQPRAASVPRRQPSARARGPVLPCLRAPGQDGAAQREDGQVRAKRSTINSVSGVVLDTDRPIHRCTPGLLARPFDRQGARRDRRDRLREVQIGGQQARGAGRPTATTAGSLGLQGVPWASCSCPHGELFETDPGSPSRSRVHAAVMSSCPSSLR
jgi:hypothetical protein